MFNTFCSKVYQKMRERSGLTQEQLGDGMGATRHGIRRFETGETMPDAAQERRMMEVTNCSKLAFVEMVCEELGELIGAPVGIKTDHGSYEPTSLLTQAYSLLQQPDNGISPGPAWALDRKVIGTRLLGLAFQINNAELEELTEGCREEAERKEKS